MERITMSIDGMSCGHCLARVKSALAGVGSVRIEDARIGRVTVSYDPSVANEAQLRDAVAQSGYTVSAVAKAA